MARKPLITKETGILGVRQGRDIEGVNLVENIAPNKVFKNFDFEKLNIIKSDDGRYSAAIVPELDTPDGSGYCLRISMAAGTVGTGVESVQVGFWINGTSLGLSLQTRRRNASQPKDFTVTVDGVVYPVELTGRKNPYTLDENRLANPYHYMPICKDLSDKHPHWVEMSWVGTGDGVQYFNYLLGYIIDKTFEYDTQDICTLGASGPLSCTKTFQNVQTTTLETSSLVGLNYNLEKLKSLLFNNISATAIKVLLRDSVLNYVFWRKTIPAGETVELNFPASLKTKTLQAAVDTIPITTVVTNATVATTSQFSVFNTDGAKFPVGSVMLIGADVVAVTVRNVDILTVDPPLQIAPAAGVTVFTGVLISALGGK